jgi:hypothetical protein
VTRTPFEGFLNSIRAWLQAARHEEVLALHALVTAEIAARKLIPTALSPEPARVPPDARASPDGNLA